jgi:hypothetical protein
MGREDRSNHSAELAPPHHVPVADESTPGATGTRTGGWMNRENRIAIAARTHAPTDCHPTCFVFNDK